MSYKVKQNAVIVLFLVLVTLIGVALAARYEQLNVTELSLGGVQITATAAELNALDGITATVTELNYMDGVTHNLSGGIVTMDSTTYTVLAANAGKLHVNTGLGATTATIPECSTVLGKEFSFAVLTAATLNVDVAAADKIVPLTNAAGDKIQTTGTLGDYVCLMCADVTNLVQCGDEVGTWADAN
jgi:hypothetical protein